MISLIASVLLSSSLFLGFKYLSKLRIDLIPVISGNYISCILTGFILNRGFEVNKTDSGLLMACLSLGILFFLVFYAMGYASSNIGVGISSASSKLSLLIPVLYGSIVLNEPFTFSKFISALLVIPAVILMTQINDRSLKSRSLLLPFFIFLGSGVIDTSLNILQSSLKSDSASIISLLIFFGAFISSLIFILFRRYRFHQLTRGMAYGLILGIPNYFSIYFLLKALRCGEFNSSEFYLLNNTGTMLLSFGMAYLLFSEKLNFKTILGILLACISIYLILFS